MLDPFSCEVREKLLNRFPEWREHAREETEESGSSYLAVLVPAPPEAQTPHGLCITTENAEITIGFDHYHAHLGVISPMPNQIEPDALSFIEQIVGEQVAVVSWWEGERWLDSSQLLPNERLSQPEWLVHLGEGLPRIRSWKGAHNHWSRT
ncbi:hypothetical protein [Xanthomonas sacchari]|uniref:hypothetical protein n=1 Tax=Xanthomonas sacchari TaxID=56458 RepID=UPI00225E670A|nr:hypothetical protein [Xanthomonas sacchari]MCW0436079.1 hypothetical protein [Xanthomonas sacchari]